jgi:ubiquinone/menaquinone biosynthesis C-methylase UbiE
MPYMQLFSPFCPSCREGLARNGESFTCSRCGRVFPQKNGIIDFLSAFPIAEEQMIVQKNFDSVSETYDNAIVRLVEGLGCKWRTYTGKVEEFMKEAGGKVILDVGCGTAFPAGSFIPPTSIYVGLDISLRMLEHAQSLLGGSLNATFWGIDAERIPLPNSCIDLCLVLMGLNVFPNPEKAVEEIRRVVKKDGQVFGTAFSQQPAGDEGLHERAASAGFIRKTFAAFDSSFWDISLETEGGILFYHIRKKA